MEVEFGAVIDRDYGQTVLHCLLLSQKINAISQNIWFSSAMQPVSNYPVPPAAGRKFYEDRLLHAV
jgi:hypothetical protein